MAANITVFQVIALLVLLQPAAEASATGRSGVSLPSMRHQAFTLLKRRDTHMPSGFRILSRPTPNNPQVTVEATEGATQATRVFKLESLDDAKGLIPQSSIIEVRGKAGALSEGDRIIYSRYKEGKVADSISARVASLQRDETFDAHYASYHLYRKSPHGVVRYDSCPVPSYVLDLTAVRSQAQGRHQDLGRAIVKNYIEQSEVIYLHGKERFPIFAGVEWITPEGTRLRLPSSEQRQFTGLAETLRQSTARLLDAVDREGGVAKAGVKTGDFHIRTHRVW